MRDHFNCSLGTPLLSEIALNYIRLLHYNPFESSKVTSSNFW